MTTILRAALDEGRRVFLDWGVLIITVVAVVVYSFFYPVPYTPEVLRDVPVAIVDGDRSAMSRALARMIDAHENVRIETQCGSTAEAESLVRTGRVIASVVIPDGLERDVLRGQRVRVAAHVDASYMLAYSHVLKGLLESAGTMSAGVEVARWRAAGKTADAAMNARQPVAADLRPLFSPAGGYGAYVVPAVLVLVLQQTLLIGAGIAGGTRREQLASGTPSRPGAPAAGVFAPVFQTIGRSVPYLALYSVNLWYCFGFVLPYQGYPVVGPPVAVAWFAVPFLLATTFLALALRGLFRRRETAVQTLLFTSLPFVFLGGFSWPSEALPHWLRTAAQLVPTTTAIPGFLRIARMGAGLPDVGREAAMLWVLVLLYFPLACWAEASLARAGDGFPDRRSAES